MPAICQGLLGTVANGGASSARVWSVRGVVQREKTGRERGEENIREREEASGLRLILAREPQGERVEGERARPWRSVGGTEEEGDRDGFAGNPLQTLFLFYLGPFLFSFSVFI